MNVIERMLDNSDPGVSVRLRALKKRWQNDQIRSVMAALVPAGTVAVDVGANRGVYTYILSAMVGPSGRVHSVEPYPRNVLRLQALARRRGNITVYPVALSDSAGEAALHVPVYQGKHIDALATLGSVRGAGCDEFHIPLRTLDEVLSDEHGRVTLLKCDVEGHEDQVLRGSADVLRKHMPTIIVEIEQRHRTDPMDSTFSYLLEFGYVGYFLAKPGPRPLSEFDVQRHQLAWLTSEFVAYNMPDGYVSDFLFVRPGTPLGRLGVGPRPQRSAGTLKPARIPRPRRGDRRGSPTTSPGAGGTSGEGE